MITRLTEVIEKWEVTFGRRPKAIYMSERTAHHFLNIILMAYRPDSKLTAYMGIPIVSMPMEFGEFAVS